MDSDVTNFWRETSIIGGLNYDDMATPTCLTTPLPFIMVTVSQMGDIYAFKNYADFSDILALQLTYTKAKK